MPHNLGTLIEHLGHTSFAVERNAHRVLFDPILARSDHQFRASTFPGWYDAGLDRVQAVFISHGHDDHLHPPSLLRLPRNLPIYYFDEDPNNCSCSQAPVETLAKLGFLDCRPFRAGERISVGADVSVEGIPARPSTEGEEQVCFLVETPDVTLLDAVDIRDGEATRKALESWRGAIDIAFVPTGSSMQWQGFCNQMDPVQAVEFCRWLQPKRVATCGGALSLSQKPRQYTLERYPYDFADWLSVAQESLGNGHVVGRRPPFLLQFVNHELNGSPRQPLCSGFTSGIAVAPALFCSIFTGYDPRQPTQRRILGLDDLPNWLGRLADLRDLIGRGSRSWAKLLERCDLSTCKLPAALLAFSTLQWLTGRGLFPAAGEVCSVCPPPSADPVELEFSFFSILEAHLETLDLPVSDAVELRECLEIDRSMYRLRMITLQLRRLASYPETQAAALIGEHVRDIRSTFRQRRPVLGLYHLLLDAKRACLLTGEPLAAGKSALLCFSAHSGVQWMPLDPLERLFLDMLDGRTVPEIVQGAARRLNVSENDVETALFSLLARLSGMSAVVINWCGL